MEFAKKRIKGSMCVILLSSFSNKLIDYINYYYSFSSKNKKNIILKINKINNPNNPILAPF